MRRVMRKHQERVRVECITCDGDCLVGEPTRVSGEPTLEHFRFDVVYAQVGSVLETAARPQAGKTT